MPRKMKLKDTDVYANCCCASCKYYVLGKRGKECKINPYFMIDKYCDKFEMSDFFKGRYEYAD